MKSKQKYAGYSSYTDFMNFVHPMHFFYEKAARAALSV